MKGNKMFKSLRSRILAAMICIVSFTVIIILIFVQKGINTAVLNAHNENNQNILNAIILNIENQYQSIIFHKTATLDLKKINLKNITNLSISIIEGFHQRYQEGLLTEDQAKQLAISEINRYRYDDGVGYVWINDTGQPFPKMVMHPTLPYLNGLVMDDPQYNNALGTDKNLFTAFVDVCMEFGDGFVDYLWPKPTNDGLSDDQPKISYVKLFKEWGWIVGSGVYIDDIEEEEQKRLNAVLEELKDTFSKITIGESGYLYMFDGDINILIHPTLEDTDGSTIINQETGRLLFAELIDASETDEKVFDYIWNKPQFESEYRFKKKSYIRYFEPLDWYIASSVYVDEIKNPARIVSRKILLLSIVFLALALIVSLFLTQNFTKSLRQLTKAAKKIEEKGMLNSEIPVSGTNETKELGTILSKMILSVQRTEKQLRQAQKMEMVGTLAGGLAHDFNNVLGGITGTLSVMKFTLQEDDVIERDKLDEYLATMMKCGERAEHMVQQLLSVSRKQELNFEAADLNEIVQEVIKISDVTFEKSINVHSRYFEKQAIVWADSNLLEQVLLNFCVNAVHSMTIMRGKDKQWGGELTISINKVYGDEYFCRLHLEAEEREYYAISIKDSGVGIDSKTLSKIFNPFFTTKEKGEGTGLGLAMVYNIIQQHNGFIDVYSELGIGTTFNVYIPVLNDKIIKKEITDDKNKILFGKGLILVVDDEKTMREIARDILTTCGYQVILAENGKEGLELFREKFREIKVVLLDMAMPKMSGKVAFFKMQQIDPDLKVVLTSGFRQDNRVEDVLKHGIKNFIQKPYTMEKLSSIIYKTIYTEELD